MSFLLHMENLADHHLHIVCHDVPYPVDHGGIFDLFYKIVSLSAQGIKIHLHCFEYGRGPQAELNKYCEEVIYYKRQRGLSGFSLILPYIINSRKNKQLLVNLLKDDYPVLLEGIHCTYFLYQNKLLHKKVFIRLHNVEFKYYKQLSKSATSLLEKLFFLHESRLLKKYEQKISSRAMLITVTLKDKAVYEEEFGVSNIDYLPVFLPYHKIKSKEGKGSFCLYHGNLSVAENEEAVEWLLKNVFNTLPVPFVIAGKQPSKKLHRLTHQNKNTCLIADPTDEEINDLIRKAHINILPSFNVTGIKIKLLNALFNGRYCLVNAEAVDGTGLHSLCSVAGNKRVLLKSITELNAGSFTHSDKQLREEILLTEYDNAKNAAQLIQWIY